MYFHTFVCCLKVQRHAYKVAVRVSLHEGALHVQSGREAHPLWYLAEGICVADRAVQDQPWVFALCGDDIELADGCAVWPLLRSVVCAAVKGHDPTMFDLLAQELFQQLRVLLCLRPVALAMQKAQAVEVIFLECWLSLLPLKAGWDVLQCCSMPAGTPSLRKL